MEIVIDWSFRMLPLKRVLYIVVGLFAGAAALAASVPDPSYASALTFTVPQIVVAVSHGSVKQGAEQTLAIQIDELEGRRTSLILVVTYPSGEVARSLHYIESGMGTISWTVPTDAGIGNASFRLIADGCTCGEQNTIPKQKAVDGRVEGEFTIYVDE